MKINLALIVLPFMALVSCEYEQAKPSTKSSCDTLNVSYSKSIVPILQRNCYSCHSTSVTSQTDGLDLENFASLKDYLNLGYAGDGIYGSKFLHAIKQQGYLLYMPPTYKMSACEISTIGIWIKAGALKN